MHNFCQPHPLPKHSPQSKSWKIVFCDIKRQYDCLKCLRASVSHQLPSSCRSGVIFSLVSDSIAAIYQSMGPLSRWVNSKTVKRFCLLFGERLRRLFGSLSAGCCCRLNGKNLQMFEMLCIVSPLGAVLVHNLEGRGILSSAHNNHQSRKWNCQNWDPTRFSTIQGDPWWV